MPRLRIGRPLQTSAPIGTEHDTMDTLSERRLFQATGIALATGACAALIWYVCIPGSLPLGDAPGGAVLIVLLTATVGHELLHMLGFPRFGCDTNTVAGVWPQTGCPYAQYLAPMSRNRFILACSLPFLVLCMLPFLLAAAGIGPVDCFSWLSVATAVAVASDLHIIVRVSGTVPANAWVMESGDALLWGCKDIAMESSSA